MPGSATNEQWPLGFLQSFGLKADGSLSAPLSTAGTGGEAPAHALVLSNGLVVAMNYNTGDGTIFNATTADGKLSSDSSQYISFPKATGEISHPHQVYEHNKELFIPDLVCHESYFFLGALLLQSLFGVYRRLFALIED